MDSLLSPNTLIRIILIQQPEPSDSEAGESRVRNRGREMWPTKHLTHCNIIKLQLLLLSNPLLLPQSEMGNFYLINQKFIQKTFVQ
jgi:hypothetical protein